MYTANNMFNLIWSLALQSSFVSWFQESNGEVGPAACGGSAQRVRTDRPAAGTQQHRGLERESANHHHMINEETYSDTFTNYLLKGNQ